MGKIKRLPPHIANQIAAGEVVERPSSVVKELIENAIDAKADKIEIYLKEGGKGLIEVFDNGIGMAKEDLELCIEPHATSKIVKEEDLFAIKTLGFRGEALASIASVSRLSISSRQLGNSEAWKKKVDFGRIKEIEPCSCPEGTIVTVEDLFLEVPARFKFLKSPQTEFLRCLKIVHLFCVAWPEIGFKLKKNGKTILNKRVGQRIEERLELLLGKISIKNLKKIKGERKGITLLGFVADPDEIRISSRQFHFFINRRPVVNPVLWKAVNEAFRGHIVKGNYPAGIVFLDIDPALVDINVHPAKSEVRFESPQEIFRLLYHSIKNGLENKDIFTATQHKEEIFSYSETSKEEDEKDIVKEQIPLPWEERDKNRQTQTKDAFPSALLKNKNNVDDHFVIKGDKNFEVIGQFANSYILFEKENKLFVLDQHAAHEAVIFKRLMEEFEQKGLLQSQKLLFPIIYDLLPDDFLFVKNNMDLLKRLGMEISEFGPQQIIINALPQFLVTNEGQQEIVSNILNSFINNRDSDAKDIVKDLFSKMACALAIKANTRLKNLQMSSLIEEVHETGVTNCPHGRPILKVITLDELEREFFRK